jgi:hypothetical protein
MRWLDVEPRGLAGSKGRDMGGAEIRPPGLDARQRFARVHLELGCRARGLAARPELGGAPGSGGAEREGRERDPGEEKASHGTNASGVFAGASRLRGRMAGFHRGGCGSLSPGSYMLIVVQADFGGWSCRAHFLVSG